mgnify:CR=1 FL=1
METHNSSSLFHSRSKSSVTINTSMKRGWKQTVWVVAEYLFTCFVVTINTSMKRGWKPTSFPIAPYGPSPYVTINTSMKRGWKRYFMLFNCSSFNIAVTINTSMKRGWKLSNTGRVNPHEPKNCYNQYLNEKRMETQTHQ